MVPSTNASKENTCVIRNSLPSIPDPSDHQPPPRGRHWVLVPKFLQNRKQPCTELFLYISAKGLVDLHFLTPLDVWGSGVVVPYMVTGNNILGLKWQHNTPIERLWRENITEHTQVLDL